MYQEDEEGSYKQRAESGNQLGDADASIDEDQELKMKIVLYYHTLVSLVSALTIKFIVSRCTIPVVQSHATAQLQ